MLLLLPRPPRVLRPRPPLLPLPLLESLLLFPQDRLRLSPHTSEEKEHLPPERPSSPWGPTTTATRKSGPSPRK